MQDIEVITLEDNMDYYVVERINLNGFTYLILSNVDDNEDVCIRKEIVKDDKPYISMLSSEEELQAVLEYYQKKP